jgi:dTMP kinase
MIITLEGLDASGKATQTARLVEKIPQALWRPAASMSFPLYGNLTGRVIHRMLREGPSEDRALILQALMTTNRLEALEAMRPLAAGYRVLVLDRYFASGIAYGTNDGLPVEFLRRIHSTLPQPDLSILIDIPVDESFRRRPVRQDLYESDHSRLAAVRDHYLGEFRHRRSNGDPWYVVDGVGFPDEVFDRVWRIVCAEVPPVNR